MRDGHILEAGSNRLIERDFGGRAAAGGAAGDDVVQFNELVLVDSPRLGRRNSVSAFGEKPPRVDDNAIGQRPHVGSSSRCAGSVEPIELMWRPAQVVDLSDCASSAGPVPAVLVPTTKISAPWIAASTRSTGAISMFSRFDISSAKRSRRDGWRLNTLARRTGRTATVASKCERASAPEPMTPTTAASLRASCLIAAPLAAAVRMKVM